MTQRDLIVLALDEAGFTERKRQGRYLAYGRPGETRRLLLGAAGAVRRTSGSVADSVPVSDREKTALLARGRELKATTRRKG